MIFSDGRSFRESLLDSLLREEVGVLLLGSVVEHGGGPELRGEEAVGLGERVVHRHGQVTSRAGVSGG